MTSTTMSAAPGSSRLAGVLLSILAVVALVVIGALLLTNTQAAVAGEVTAKGGNGKVTTAGAEFNVRITATQNGPQCEYKPYWTDGTQIGSGFFFPCTEEGYQQHIKQLHEWGKIPQAIYDALAKATIW